MYTTQKAIRESFWQNNTNLVRRSGSQNKQTTDTRMAWCDYVESLHRNGEITEKMAYKVTL